MRTLFNIYIMGVVMLSLGLRANAQQSDTRMRNTETVVADGLAQLPANNVEVYNQVMGEIAATGAKGVVMIADMMIPASEGKNSVFEYALNGVASYVTKPGQEKLRPAVREGFLSAIENCKDKTNKAFLMSQLQICSTADDAKVIVKYIYDDYLAAHAIALIVNTHDTDDLLLSLAKDASADKKHRSLLAHALGEKQIKAAEPQLLAWLKDADAETATVICNSLAVCGSRASLKPLAARASACNYAWDQSGATDSYLCLINTLVENGDSKTATKAAKALLKCDRESVKGRALLVLTESMGAGKAMPYVMSAIENGTPEYRFAALQSFGTPSDETFALLSSKMATYNADAQAAIIRWMGDNGAQSQISTICKATTSPNGEVASAAIEAAGRIGGEEALTALIAALEGKHADDATKALLAFNGTINPHVEKLLQSADAQKLVPALKLASARRMTSVCDKVFELLSSDNQKVKDAAYAAIPYLVANKDIERLAKLLDKADEKSAKQLQLALNRTVATLPEKEQFAEINKYMSKAENKYRYYPVLAQIGTKDAVNNLISNFNNNNNRDEAFAAMLTVDNPMITNALYGVAVDNPELVDRAIARYAELINKQKQTPSRSCPLYRMGLDLKPSAAVRSKIIGYLASIRTMPSLTIVSEYLDNKDVAPAAAAAVKSIVAKSKPLMGGAEVKAMLEKSREIYRAMNDADANYAVDEITLLLGKIPANASETDAVSTVTELSADESAKGFQMLYNGTSLDNWTGNKVNYISIDGAIDVTAAYGGTGNLYTKNEYGDFVLRFDFRFLTPGVNNGIGIRTPMGVDAAYHGMEVQVLDHNAPIYKNLKVYQRHGSVYGIIPSSDVEFKELGEWNTMEIQARGDRIKVTVNDRTVLDGNIREACKGKNVSEDGSKTNPNTVDNKNHPGLFNAKGHIGLLGHGSGMQYRHVRILDLSKKTDRK